MLEEFVCHRCGRPESPLIPVDLHLFCEFCIEETELNEARQKNKIDLQRVLDNLEKKALLEALRLTDGCKTIAAKNLGISFRSMRYRCAKHKIGEMSNEKRTYIRGLI